MLRKATWRKIGLRFGGLPMRSTQPERYSSKQHDLSVRIQRLKRPLMEKRLNTKVVGLDESFDLDIWKAQFGSRS